MKGIAHLALAAILLTFPFVVGCGKGTSELTGSIQYKNKPVVVGTVTAYDAEQNAYQGVIQDGQYSIAGIPPGSIQLIVVSHDPSGATMPQLPTGSKHKGGRDPRAKITEVPPVVGWVPLPKKYEQLSTSPLKTEVKSGPHTYDIILE